LVDGSTIYVTTSSGGIVKVKMTPSTTVQVTQSGSVSDLKPGSTVVITGSGSGGTMTAKSVSQSAGSG
jgi:UDP:flavonoid glycosyltransferase YjiC (YdhE family)